MCSPSIVKHIRELEPTPDGWRQIEDTGQACTTCTCGVTTGFIPTPEASATYREHGGEMPQQAKREVRGESGPELIQFSERSRSV